MAVAAVVDRKEVEAVADADMDPSTATEADVTMVEGSWMRTQLRKKWRQMRMWRRR